MSALAARCFRWPASAQSEAHRGSAPVKVRRPGAGEGERRVKAATRRSRATAVVFALAVLGACTSLHAGGDNADAGAHLYAGPIVIGVETWPGYFPLLVARDEGYFAQAGLNVTIKRYAGLGQLSRDYQAGKMQGRANLTLDAVNETLHGLDHRIVLAIDYSTGSDAIMAKKSIANGRDFRGKRVGFEPGTLEEFFLTWALNQNELDLDDVVPVHGDPEQTARQLRDGTLDVAVSHEPYLSRFVQAGEFHPVYSSADAPGLITDVLTFRTDFIRAHPETVRAFIRVYFRALDDWKRHPERTHAVVAREFGDTPEAIATQLGGVTMLDERDNRTAFTFAAGFLSLYGNMRQIGEFIQDQDQRHSRDLDTDALVDRRFVVASHE